MADGHNPIHVTRREFYLALLIVWMYIMFVLGDLMRIQERWTMWLLWAASFVMVIAYSVLCFSAMRSRGTATKVELSDRVKQLADDPSQKIEAIKVCREETGASLAEAKEAVEAFINSK